MTIMVTQILLLMIFSLNWSESKSNRLHVHQFQWQCRYWYYDSDAKLNVAYTSVDTNPNDAVFQDTIRVRGDRTSAGSGPAITFTNYHSSANDENPDTDIVIILLQFKHVTFTESGVVD